MIKSSLADKVCQLHKKKIISVCFNLNCNQNRLVCFDCLTADELHIGHQKSLKEFQGLEEILNQKILEYQNLISRLKKMIDETLFSFYRLKNGIDNKYNLTIQRINIMSNDQFNQYVANIIQIDQQAEVFTKKIENICSDFTNKLNNLVIELKLDQLNYVEISKEDQEKVQKLHEEGYILYWDKDDYKEAIKIFDKSLIYNPNNLDSLWGKGESLRLMGQRKESIEWYDKALAINPQHVSSLFGKGEALRLVGQYKESIEWHDQALAINPQYVSSLFGKGEALRLMGQYKESIEWHDQALAINPQYVSSLFGKGEALRLMNQYKESLEWYNKALANNSQHVFSLSGKGDSLNFLQNYAEAFDVLSKALQLNPNHTLSLDRIKICKEKLNI